MSSKKSYSYCFVELGVLELQGVKALLLGHVQ